MRPFTRRHANLTLDGIALIDELLEGPADKRHVVSARELAVGESVLDLAYADSTVELEQVYVKLFDGDLLGRLQVQLAALQPLDLRVATDIQLTGVDLAYLDPHGTDESVQANRRLLAAWYTRAVRPEVERVSVWMDHQLNLDIRLGAVWPFGAILRHALSRVRIRRLSIKPFLLGSDEQTTRPAAGSMARRAGVGLR